MINSIKYQLFKEEMKRDTEQTRIQIRNLCKEYDYKTSLLDLYNKTFQLSFEGLSEYIETKLPKKYLKLLLNNL